MSRFLKPFLLSLLSCSFASAGVLNAGEQLPSLSAPVHKMVADAPSLPVGGDVWPVAIFWMEISVGTPGRVFPVAIDTGSGALDIPSSKCSTCITTPPNNNYDEQESSTSTPTPCGRGCRGSCVNNQCSFSNSYQTCDLSNPTAVCTIKGVMYTDEVSIGGLGPVNVSFGAITSQTSNFDQFKNIDGVLGLTGSTSTSNVFSQLVAHGFVQQNVVAMCFQEGAVSNGTITIGGVDPTLYHDNIRYTRNTAGRQMYSLNLLSLSVNATSTGAAGGIKVSGAATQDAILDSGTNVLLLPNTPFKSMKSIFLQLCEDGASLHGICDVDEDSTLFDNKCFELTSEEISSFPVLSFELEDGVQLTMSGVDYLLLNNPLCPTQYSLGIRNTGNSFLIVGDTLMQNYYTVLDIAHQKIGFAPVNRATCGSQPLFKWDQPQQQTFVADN